MKLTDAETNGSPDFAEALPRDLQQMEAKFLRYSVVEETSYLSKLAKRDAWSSLYQWLFPAIILSLLVLGFWFYRKELESLIQHEQNPRELNTFVTIMFQFFALLLHLVLVGYIVKIQRMLKHFRYSGSASSVQQPEPKSRKYKQVAIQGQEIRLLPSESSSASSNYPIFRLTGKPNTVLSLILTSRSGLRRYRWHYYIDELALTPLRQARSILPLYVQKKAWKDLGQADPEELETLFPDNKWLKLCLQCKRKNMDLQVDVVLVEYYDFHFYYLCAVQAGRLSTADELIQTGFLYSTEQEYQLQEGSGTAAGV